ncbi:MAG: hypothetical protein ACR2J3_07690 [Aridibacter sp.]
MNKKTPFENELEKPEIENDTRNQAEREIEKVPKDKPEIGEESSWSKDQQERNYYYDDDHGYEKYDPEKDENEN